MKGERFMLNEWLVHPHLRTSDKILMLLFEVGAARAEQLASLLDLKESSVQKKVFLIRKKGVSPQEELKVKRLKREIDKYRANLGEADAETRSEYQRLCVKHDQQKNEWIKIDTLAESGKSVYRLGIQGLNYVYEFMQRSQRPQELGEGQLSHHVGLLDIFIRLIQRYGKDGFQWFSTWESTDFLFRNLELLYRDQWKRDPQRARNERREVIRPDARLFSKSKAFWIENDNGSEWTRQLEDKMKEYVATLARIENQDPIVWVTVNEFRKKKLEQIWEYVRQDYKNPPKMYFFKAGEETDFLGNTPILI